MKEYIVQAKDNYDFWDLVFYQDGKELKELIRCKDCKYFELDYVDREAMGIPLIMAHEICMRWGDGCKTSPDGYCFMAERKDNETNRC